MSMSFRRKKRLDPSLEGVDLHMDEVIRQGWLSKRGNRVKNWKKRWFTLNRLFLIYSKSARQDTSKPQGVIKVADIQAVNLVELANRKKAYGMEVVTSKRVYVMSASSQAVRNAWMKSIQELVTENLASKHRARTASSMMATALLSSTATAMAHAHGGGAADADGADAEEDEFCSGTMIIKPAGNAGQDQDDEDYFDAGTMIVRDDADADGDDYYDAGTMIQYDPDDEVFASATMIMDKKIGKTEDNRPSFLRYIEEHQEEEKEPAVDLQQWDAFTCEELQTFVKALENQRSREVNRTAQSYEELRMAVLLAVSDCG